MRESKREEFLVCSYPAHYLHFSHFAIAHILRHSKRQAALFSGPVNKTMLKFKTLVGRPSPAHLVYI